MQLRSGWCRVICQGHANFKTYLNYVELAKKVAIKSRDVFGWLIGLGVEFPPKLKIRLEFIERSRIIVGNTIEELAIKAGMDPAGLAETVKRYNRFVEEGKYEDFGEPRLLAKIEKPPFYAAPQWPAVRHTMGGTGINIKAQVLDDSSVLIPKLYATGKITSGVHGACRPGSFAVTDSKYSVGQLERKLLRNH